MRLRRYAPKKMGIAVKPSRWTMSKVAAKSSW
jgi:hypothetical protein